MPYYDFEKIKRDVPIERSLIYLKLKFEKDENGWRIDCPKCGGERSIAINPIKNVFFCHEAETGGDVLSFVSHVLNVGVKEAAKFLLEHSEKPEVKKTVPKKSEKVEKKQPVMETFNPLSHILPEHELVQSLGFPAEIAEQLGVGFAVRGMMKGFVAVPLRSAEGVLAGYIGVRTDVKLPTTWHLPVSNVIPLNPKKRA